MLSRSESRAHRMSSHVSRWLHHLACRGLANFIRAFVWWSRPVSRRGSSWSRHKIACCRQGGVRLIDCSVSRPCKPPTTASRRCPCEHVSVRASKASRLLNRDHSCFLLQRVPIRRNALFVVSHHRSCSAFTTTVHQAQRQRCSAYLDY